MIITVSVLSINVYVKLHNKVVKLTCCFLLAVEHEPKNSLIKLIVTSIIEKSLVSCNLLSPSHVGRCLVVADQRLGRIE